MKQFSFATIITSTNNLPTATHLPFLVSEEKESITLTSHFAKANAQWKELENNNVLVIFSEPHAYISPKHYDSERNVPTWNYVSVHAYGKGTIVTDAAKVAEILEQTIDQYEMAYRQQWENLPEAYRLNLAKGIVAFNIHVTDLQAKQKLSQNKTPAEQERIIRTLQASDDKNEQVIAEYMKQNLGGTN